MAASLRTPRRARRTPGRRAGRGQGDGRTGRASRPRYRGRVVSQRGLERHPAAGRGTGPEQPKPSPTRPAGPGHAGVPGTVDEASTESPENSTENSVGLPYRYPTDSSAARLLAEHGELPPGQE